MTNFQNAYADACRADSYATLEFPSTYYLAYRDFPDLFNRFVTGKRSLDFGCGTGRSTRFLGDQGFEATGIDISEDMIQKARFFDTDGDYRVIDDGDFSSSILRWNCIPMTGHRLTPAGLMRIPGPGAGILYKYPVGHLHS